MEANQNTLQERLKNRLRPFLKYVPVRIRFFLYQKNTYCIPVWTRVKAAVLGFSPDEYVLYDFKRNDRRNYVKEYERYLFRDMVRDYRIVFDNKMLFYYMMKDIAPVNKLYAYKAEGDYRVVTDGYDIESIPERLKDDAIIVFKPTTQGGGGKGFHLLEWKKGIYYVNRKQSSMEEIVTLLKQSDAYILEEYCRQSEFERELFPETVNTLRIITVEQKNGDFECILAIQRMGAVTGVCADNASLGGMFCMVNIESGELSAAHSYAPSILFKNDGRHDDYPEHPTTGKQLKGLVIPNFEYIKNEACRIHRCIRYTGAHFVAWDFALTDDGYRVIEGNTSCGNKFIQFTSGQRFEALGKWMKDWGYIK